MALRLGEMLAAKSDLHIEPTPKRVRAKLGAATVVDRSRGLLVWEPRRVAATYAVPIEDDRGELVGPGASTAPRRCRWSRWERAVPR